MALCGIRRHSSEKIRELSRVVMMGLEVQNGFGCEEWRDNQHKGPHSLGD